MKHTIMLLTVLGLTSGAVSAAQPFYALLEGGVTQAQLSNSVFQDSVNTWQQDPESVGASTFRHQSALVLRLGVGYHINDRFSVEAFYDRLGQYDAGMKLLAVSSATGDSAQMNTKEKVSLSGVSSRLVYHYQMSDKFNLLAGAGVSYLNNESEQTVSMNNYAQPTQTGKISKQTGQWSPTVGIGADYTMTDKVSLRAWYGRYFNAAHSDNLPDFDLDTLSAGVLVRW